MGQDIVLFPSGALQLQGGTLDVQSVNFHGSGGQFQAISGLLHVGVFHGNLLNQGATLAPGHSAGDVAIVGNFTQQSSGALEMEIGGDGQGSQYDFVNVTGNATKDGSPRAECLPCKFAARRHACDLAIRSIGTLDAPPGGAY